MERVREERTVSSGIRRGDDKEDVVALKTKEQLMREQDLELQEKYKARLRQKYLEDPGNVDPRKKSEFKESGVKVPHENLDRATDEKDDQYQGKEKQLGMNRPEEGHYHGALVPKVPESVEEIKNTPNETLGESTGKGPIGKPDDASPIKSSDVRERKMPAEKQYALYDKPANQEKLHQGYEGAANRKSQIRLPRPDETADEHLVKASRHQLYRNRAVPEDKGHGVIMLSLEIECRGEFTLVWE